jgi:predicted ATPase
MITKIEIDGFKSFLDFSMELRPLTVVLGANAAGKSNLLDALQMFKRIAHRNNLDAIRSERGDGAELFHRSSSGEVNSALSITIYTSNYGDCYRANLSRQQNTFQQTILANGSSYGNPADMDDEDLALFTVLDMLARNLNLLDPNPAALRKPSRDFDEARLRSDGSNLAAALAALERVVEGEGRTRLDVLRQALGQLVPGVRSVEIRHDEEVAEHRLSIITRDGTKLPARLASDGTLRMLALLAALFDAEGGTLCFEEPENGLHPGQLRALIELLVERTAADVQPPLEVISTSHSPVVLAALIEAQRAAPEQVGIYFMDTARHIPEGATDPSQISTVSRVRRVVSDGESGRDVVTRGEVERYLHTADVEG